MRVTEVRKGGLGAKKGIKNINYKKFKGFLSTKCDKKEKIGYDFCRNRKD